MLDILDKLARRPAIGPDMPPWVRRWMGEQLKIHNDTWSRRSDLNRRPSVYETLALPLSYAGYHILYLTTGLVQYLVCLTRQKEERPCKRHK